MHIVTIRQHVSINTKEYSAIIKHVISKCYCLRNLVKPFHSQMYRNTVVITPISWKCQYHYSATIIINQTLIQIYRHLLSSMTEHELFNILHLSYTHCHSSCHQHTLAQFRVQGNRIYQSLVTLTIYVDVLQYTFAY